MESYAREVLPLVLYAFPYIPTAERPSYRKDTRRYLYTGILYDKHDLSRIADVEDAKTTELSFEVERDGERYTLSIQPLLRDESTLIPQ